MARAMFGLEDSIESKSKPLRSERSFLARSLGWLTRGILVVCQVALIAWGTLAIYYSNLPWAELQLILPPVEMLVASPLHRSKFARCKPGRKRSDSKSSF